MTTEEIHSFASDDWRYRRKAERDRWLKHPEVHRDYLAKSMTRGWAFLGVSPESHAADVERIKDALKTWSPA